MILFSLIIQIKILIFLIFLNLFIKPFTIRYIVLYYFLILFIKIKIITQHFFSFSFLANFFIPLGIFLNMFQIVYKSFHFIVSFLLMSLSKIILFI